MNYLAIDLGSSFIKAGVVDVEHFSLQQIQRIAAPPRAHQNHPSVHESDPDEFVRMTRTLIDSLRREYACEGIVMCGQMGGVVVTSPDAAAISPYISWQDSRGAEIDDDGVSCFQHVAKAAGEHWTQRLGNELRPGLPIVFLHWLRRHKQLAAGSTPVALADYVAARICRTPPVSEWTSATGTADIRTRSWPLELCDQLGLGDLCWPAMVDYRHQVGTIDGAVGEIPVYAAVGDHQCALAGSMLCPGELSINISTGSQVAMLSGEDRVEDYQLRPYFDENYLRAVTHIPAGRALSSLVGLLSEFDRSGNRSLDDAWQYAVDQAATIEDNDVEVNLSLFPCAVPGPGGIGNLRESNMTVGHLFHAALNQMASYYESCSSRISPERDWNSIVYSGGLAHRSELLREMIGQRLGTAHRVTTTTEDTMFGLMILARVISGHAEDVSTATDQFLAR